ncbi:MAG TPA: glycosyltransferase [Victivallales bacterium]|nr:glycosyltransferase [Victivallales bacterium]
MTDFSIVIPAYNEEDLLPETLKSLKTILGELSAKFAGEIIVVDNNSTDKTGEIARAFGAKLVFERENCIARARNAGAAAAEGLYIIFIDADTLAPTELIEKAILSMASGEVCGGGCIVGFEEGEVDNTAKILAELWNRLIVRIYPVAAGSFVFCLKEAWKAVGGFDERYYASEEIHFSTALRRWGRSKGLKFKIIPMKVKSSSRKFKTYSKWQIFQRIMPLILFPWRLRNRKSCSIWYERKNQR